MARIRSESIDLRGLVGGARDAFVDELYAVQREVFAGVTRDAFARYVVNSDADESWLEVFRDGDRAVGYMALHRFERTLEGERCSVFRAEAGTLRAYRGRTKVGSLFLTRMLPFKLRNPRTPVYYLGSLVHPSSYHAFARFVEDIWPRANTPTPPALLNFMCELGDEFGLEVVAGQNPLVRKVGWTTRDSEAEAAYWRRCDKPTVRFFVDTNPGYVAGDGLLTLIPVTLNSARSALKDFARGRAKRRLGALHAAVQFLPALRPTLKAAELTQVLAANPLLAQLEPAALERLAANSEAMILPAGRTLFHAGEPGDAMYLILQGAIYVVQHAAGREQILDQMTTGEVFGEIALLSGEPRSATIRTATASKFLRIDRSVVDEMRVDAPDLYRGIWSLLARRRFNSALLEQPRYRHLNRDARGAWFDQRQIVILDDDIEVDVKGPSVLFLAAGRVEASTGDAWLSTRGPALIEIGTQVRLRAQGEARIACLPANPAQASAA